MTWIFWAPAPVRTTSNSSFSSSAGSSAAAGAGGGGHGDRRGGGDAELLLERVEQFLELEDGHVGDRVEDLFLVAAMMGVLLVSREWCGGGSGGRVEAASRFLLIDEGREAVGEVARQGLQQAGGLDERRLQGAGEAGQQLVA